MKNKLATLKSRTTYIDKMLPTLLFGVSMLLVLPVEPGKIPVFLPIILVLSLIQNIMEKNRRYYGGKIWKESLKTDWPIFLYLIYTVFTFFKSFFVLQLAGTMNLEFYMLLLITCLLHFTMGKRDTLERFWVDLITFAGAVAGFLLILFYFGVEGIGNVFILLRESSGTIASYLLPVAILSVWKYCFHTTRIEAITAGITAGISFLALLLNQNQASIWLMILVFMAIPCIYRPRADLIMRTMQLFFVFVFMWCNMSLIVNYTEWIKIPLKYGLETSIYLELLLAIGGVAFFHFWDMLPEGKNLHFISMVRLQQYYFSVVGILILILTGALSAKSFLAAFPDEGAKGAVKSLFLPLSQELQIQNSSFILCVKELGLVLALPILIYLVRLGARLYKKTHQDKNSSNLLFILYVVFIISFFVWEMSDNIILIYTLLFIVGKDLREKPILVKEKKDEDLKDEK